MSSMTKGHIIIGGRHFEVTDVRLRRGQVEVTFIIPGPAEPFSGPISVFGEDGLGLWQGSDFTVSRGVPEHAHWECHYGMQMAAVLGPRNPAEFHQ
jgi:hypothetical protein